MHNKQLIIVISIGIILITGITYIWKTGGAKRKNNPKISDEILREDQIDTSNWKTYQNDELGIKFQYPPEDCVGFFSKENLGSIYTDDVQFEYHIKISDAGFRKYKISGGYCESFAGPSDNPILSISVYKKDSPLDIVLLTYENPQIANFEMAPIMIDGIEARRIISGEGTPRRGIPTLIIYFERENYKYFLHTWVNCTSVDGSCTLDIFDDRPREEAFINEVTTITETIEFMPPKG